MIKAETLQLVWHATVIVDTTNEIRIIGMNNGQNWKGQNWNIMKDVTYEGMISGWFKRLFLVVNAKVNIEIVMFSYVRYFMVRSSCCWRVMGLGNIAQTVKSKLWAYLRTFVDNNSQRTCDWIRFYRRFALGPWLIDSEPEVKDLGLPLFAPLDLKLTSHSRCF